MNHFKISFVFLFALVVYTLAWGGGRQGQEQGYGGGSRMSRGFQEGRGFQSGQGYQGQFSNGASGRNGRQYGGQEETRKYRSNLYNDDDVYGYDANYPNGEAAYINYRSKDARARRGPEFARTSRAYSHQGGGGGGGERSFGYGQMQEYGGSMW